jgi:hypothetical protein
VEGAEVPRAPDFQNLDVSRVTGYKATRAYKILDIKTTFAIPNYGIFAQSALNEIDALKNRHIGFNRVITPNDLAALALEFDKFKVVVKKMDYTPLTLKQMLSDKRGPLKMRYMNAYNNLKHGMKPRSDVQSFIKMERFTEEKLETKPPRLIQHRSYEYLYILNKYLKPIDKFLCNSDEVIDNQKIWTMYGKGKSSHEICIQLYDLWCEFENPVALCVDQAVFDAHYNEQLHRLEHSIWNEIPAVKQNISNLLSKQYKKKCKATTQFGVRYKLNGERCSGEYNTSMGNSNSNICMIKRVMADSGIANYKLIVNGDDSVIIIENVDLPLFNVNHFTRYGMDPKLDKVAYTFEEIEFCQCSPVKVGGKWNLIRDPSKTMGKAALMLSDYRNSVDRYLTSIGLCELALNRGTPILQQFALKLIELGRGARPLDRAKSYRSKFEPSLTVEPVSYETRLSFELAFGICVADQICFEKDLGLSNRTNLNRIIYKYSNYHNK